MCSSYLWRENGFECGVSTPLILENNIYNTASLFSMQFIQNQLKNSIGNINPNQKIYRGIRSEERRVGKECR